MTNITASLVKELRELSGAGMMDCKKALTEVGGDIEAAVDWLRKKGIAKASKKSDRVAAEGLVGVASNDAMGAIVEVNSETDFVARNDKFQDMVSKIAVLALDTGGDLDKLQAASFPGGDLAVSAYLTEMIATIGENMSIRRTATLAVSKGVVADYVHAKVSDGLGKIGVLIALQSDGDKEALNTFGRQVAMHVAATNPLALDATGLDPALLEREKAILMDKAKASGKPDHILEKIAESGMKSFAKDNCLLDQGFVHDPSKSVAQAAKEAEKAVGAPIKIAGYIRYGLGEGIEKGGDEDFAAEVAAVAGIK